MCVAPAVWQADACQPRSPQPRWPRGQVSYGNLMGVQTERGVRAQPGAGRPGRHDPDRRCRDRCEHVSVLFGLAAARVLIRPPRHAGPGRSGFHGLISSIPVPEKSSVLRVASVASAVRQIAAIWASATPIGRPSVSLPQTISAYREAQCSSKGRIRSRSSSPSNPRTRLAFVVRRTVAGAVKGPCGNTRPSRPSSAKPSDRTWSTLPSGLTGLRVPAGKSSRSGPPAERALRGEFH